MGGKQSRCKKPRTAPSLTCSREADSQAGRTRMDTVSEHQCETEAPTSPVGSAAGRPEYTPEMKLMEIPEDFECAVCLEVFDKPATLPCRHTFCSACVEGLSECPVCRVSLDKSWSPKEDVRVKRKLAKLFMTCHCGARVKLADANTHAERCALSIQSMCTGAKARLTIVPPQPTSHEDPFSPDSPTDIMQREFSAPEGTVRCPLCPEILSCFTPAALLQHVTLCHPEKHRKVECPLCDSRVREERAAIETSLQGMAQDSNTATRGQRRRIAARQRQLRHVARSRLLLRHLRKKHSNETSQTIPTDGPLGNIAPEHIILQEFLLESFAAAQVMQMSATTSPPADGAVEGPTSDHGNTLEANHSQHPGPPFSGRRSRVESTDGSAVRAPPSVASEEACPGVACEVSKRHPSPLPDTVELKVTSAHRTTPAKSDLAVEPSTLTPSSRSYLPAPIAVG